MKNFLIKNILVDLDQEQLKQILKEEIKMINKS